MQRPDFQTLFQTTLKPRLESMEATRKELVAAALRCAAVAVVAGLLGLVVSLPLSVVFPPLLVLGPVAAGGLAGWFVSQSWFEPQWRQYKARFKAEVVGEILRTLDPNLVYEPDRGLSGESYDLCGIFQHSVDRYGSEDLVRGNIGATTLSFSEVHSEYKTVTTDSKGNRREQWHTIFRGLMFQADFNKHFHGKTYVLTDVAQKWLGSLGQSLQGSHDGCALVKLEDPEFEKQFVVHGSDQVEARYILSPALMARMTEFKRKLGRDPQFSFVGSCVFVAIPYNEDLFEPKLFRSGVDVAQIQGYFEALAGTTSIVEELNLNTRVWTKA